MENIKDTLSYIFIVIMSFAVTPVNTSQGLSQLSRLALRQMFVSVQKAVETHRARSTSLDHQSLKDSNSKKNKRNKAKINIKKFASTLLEP